MAISIKSKGTAKPAARKSTAKPATRKAATSTRRTAAGPKRTAKPKAAPKAAQATGTRRSPKTDMSQRELNSVLGPLTKAATQRDKFNAQWKAAIKETNDQIVAAIEAGVPVNLIVNAASVSRQHVYTLLKEIQEGKRSNGHKPAAAKRTSKPKATTAKAKTTRKAAPKASAKPRIKARG